MSRFNEYAREVDSALKAYFERFESAKAKVVDLEGKVEKAAMDHSLEGQYRLAKLRVDLDAAQDAFSAVKRENKEILREINKTRANLEIEAEKAFCVNPSMIDDKTMKLLEIGIMTVADFETLAADAEAAENFTMLRILGHAADEAAEGYYKGNRTAVQRLSVVSDLADRYTTGAVLHSFDEIVSVAKLAVGDPDAYSKERSEPNEYFFDHWDEVAGAAIEDF